MPKQPTPRARKPVKRPQSAKAKSRKIKKPATNKTTAKKGGEKAFQIDNKQIQKAVKCLREMAAKKQDLGRDLTEMGSTPLLYMTVLLRELPKTENMKPSRVQLERSVHGGSHKKFCIIVSNEFLEEYEGVIEDMGLEGWEFIGFEELRTDFKTFKRKRELLDEYELFFCEGRVYMLIKKMLGREFYQRKRYPFPIEFNNCLKRVMDESEDEDIQEETEELARFDATKFSEGRVKHVMDYSEYDLDQEEFPKFLESLVKDCAYFYPGNGPEYSLKVSRLDSSVKTIDVIKNVRRGLKGVMTRLIKMGSRLRDVRRVSLKLAQSQSLPVFSYLTEEEKQAMRGCLE